MSASPTTIAITLGDPAGIGPEVVRKSLADRRLPKGFRFEVLGTETGRGITLGSATRASAQIALRALQQAVAGCRTGKFAAMVTGPVQKEMLSRLRSDFVGQTEYLARACGLPDDAAVMMLTDPKLTVALCTNHCSLKNALKRMNPARIVSVAKITRLFLQRRGIAQPRLALAGINPHLGEGGLFGNEDERISKVAVRLLAAEGISLSLGPADTLFHQAVKGRTFDGIICAYHDQALIPFKLVAFATGVNVTLGLPIIRTSPDHGTAFGIADKGLADHRSMLAAIQLACDLTRKAKSKS